MNLRMALELCYVCYKLDQTGIFLMLFNFTETSMLILEGGGVVLTMRRGINVALIPSLAVPEGV